MTERVPEDRAHRLVAWKGWSILAWVLIMALAVGLRFYRLDAQSLWNDEGTSVALAQRDVATIARHASQDIHPPLYYYLLHIWMRVWGTSEASVRGLSALLGSLVVMLTFGLARRLGDAAPGGRAFALIAAFFVALSPFHVYYAQEARMYMPVTFFGLLSMLAFVALARHREEARDRAEAAPDVGTWPRPWGVGLYLLATIGAIYSHYFAFTLVLAQNIAFLLWLAGARVRTASSGFGRIRLILAWAGLQMVILLAYLPWLALSWRSLSNWPSVSAPLSLSSLLIAVARVFALGVTVGEGRASIALGLALAALAAVPGVWLLSKRRDKDCPLPWGLWLLLLYVAVPVAAMYLLSLSRPMYKPKFLLLATPAYHILQAWGIAILGSLITRLRRGRVPKAVLALSLILFVSVASGYSLANLYTDPAYFRDDYRGIVAYIQATAGPEDAIIVNAPSQIETVDYYYGGTWPQYPLPRQRPLDVTQTERELEQIVSRHARLYAIFWATDESDPDAFVETWLDRNCFKAMDSWFGNLRLVVYAVPQMPAEEIQHLVSADLGDAIRFHGYTLLSQSPEAGGILQVTLYWEALAPIPERYKVFTHLVDHRGNIVGQRDGEPVGGSRPTMSWQVGEQIRDNYGIPIPPGTPPGEHLLRIGMYDAESGQRLRVALGGGSDTSLTALDLALVTVARGAASAPLASLDRQSLDDVSWDAVTLVGHSLFRLGSEHQDTLVLGAGDVAQLILFWRVDIPSEMGTGSAPQPFVVSLADQTGQQVWQQALNSYESEEWLPGDLVRDIHQLQMPGDLKPGRYTLRLAQDPEPEPHLLNRINIR